MLSAEGTRVHPFQEQLTGVADASTSCPFASKREQTGSVRAQEQLTGVEDHFH